MKLLKFGAFSLAFVNLLTVPIFSSESGLGSVDSGYPCVTNETLESAIKREEKRVFENIRSAIVGGTQTIENRLVLKNITPFNVETLGDLFADRKLFFRLRDVAEKIKNICPPESCIIAGLGRSPTPVIAFLQGDTPNYAFNVPLSVRGIDTPLSVRNAKLLSNHFDRYLPNRDILNGRSILFVDYMSSGESIPKMSDLISKYLNKKDSTQEFKFAAIASVKEQRQIPADLSYVILGQENSSSYSGSDKNDSLLDAFHSGSFGAWTEFESYKVDEPFNFNPKRRPEYDDLLLELAAWKENNPSKSKSESYGYSVVTGLSLGGSKNVP